MCAGRAADERPHARLSRPCCPLPLPDAYHTPLSPLPSRRACFRVPRSSLAAGPWLCSARSLDPPSPRCSHKLDPSRSLEDTPSTTRIPARPPPSALRSPVVFAHLSDAPPLPVSRPFSPRRTCANACPANRRFRPPRGAQAADAPAARHASRGGWVPSRGWPPFANRGDATSEDAQGRGAPRKARRGGEPRGPRRARRGGPDARLQSRARPESSRPGGPWRPESPSRSKPMYATQASKSQDSVPRRRARRDRPIADRPPGRGARGTTTTTRLGRGSPQGRKAMGGKVGQSREGGGRRGWEVGRGAGGQ